MRGRRGEVGEGRGEVGEGRGKMGEERGEVGERRGEGWGWRVRKKFIKNSTRGAATNVIQTPVECNLLCLYILSYLFFFFTLFLLDKLLISPVTSM